MDVSPRAADGSPDAQREAAEAEGAAAGGQAAAAGGQAADVAPAAEGGSARVDIEQAAGPTVPGTRDDATADLSAAPTPAVSEGDKGAAAQSSPEAGELAKHRERGNDAFSRGCFDEAANLYSRALQLAIMSPEADKSVLATLYSNRSAAFASLAQAYRNRPAETSESSALYGMDPMHLAQLALNDATKAVDGMPQWTKAYSRKGLALFLLERYGEAEEAYLAGLSVDPTCKRLQEGLAQVATVLGTAKMTVKRQRSVNRSFDELECTLCLRLLYEPVTTPCGHTFCRGCYARSTDAGNKCPLCRTVLHCGRTLPITVTLASLISRAFPAEYQERKEEEDAHAVAHPGGAAGRTSSSQDTVAVNGVVTMPVFVMNSVLPFECMALNIFEPRYRLMIRRAMEGNRRFGMAQMGRNRQLESVFTEVEITECSPLPDGRFHIEVIGRRRMRLRSTSDLDGYRIAQAEPLSDEPEADGVTPPLSLLGVEVGAGVDTLITRLRTVGGSHPGVREVLQCMGPRPVPSAAEGDGADARERAHTYLERLSFWTAALLVQVSRAAVRFELLQSTNTRSRLAWCKEQLSRLDNPERCCIM